MKKETNYKVDRTKISHILDLIDTDNIAIPEIQRPFVWDNTKVKDLIDSIYRDYPIGYIVLWSGDDVSLKNLDTSVGKSVVIDGQQRIIALETALAGKTIFDNNYNEKKVQIAFNPKAENGEIFMVPNVTTKKSPAWIDDISVLFSSDFKILNFLEEYTDKNPDADRDLVYENINRLLDIKNSEIGMITLDGKLTIDAVTDIFNRLNSKGSRLRGVDFAMSKIAAAEALDGPTLKIAIDQFSHMMNRPDTLKSRLILEKESQLEGTEYYNFLKQYKMGEVLRIYKPDYGDILRVVLMEQFSRGKMKDLVSLLSGRNFEKKIYEDEIVEDTFLKLKGGVLDFINPYHFNEFLVTLSSIGFKSEKFLNSQMTIDFAYFLYLRLLKTGEVPNQEIKKFVQKWYVLTTLTGKYVNSSETEMEKDIKALEKKGIRKMLKELEESTFSDTFWNHVIPEKLNSTSSVNPVFNVYKAALIKNKARSLFSGVPVEDILILSGELHHIFPKQYLKSKGQGQNVYNQIANLTPIEPGINKRISDSSPNEYFSSVLEGCKNGKALIGSITCTDDFYETLSDNAIPKDVIDMDFNDYERFLELRRLRISKIIKDYYDSL